jgi:arsenite methyltransferase
MSALAAAAKDKDSSVVLDEVKEYYGEVLKRTQDLKTNACCTAAMPSPAMFKLLHNIHKDVNNKYYGCGFVAPGLLHDTSVLDLGCGAGRDCYILAQLVGAKGRVVGVDMTANMLDTAKATVDWHKERFGYASANTSFELGYIERLNELPSLAAGSFDVVVSNCVVNLSPDKEAVFRGAHHLLKDGGEMYFSDVYCSRRMPKDLQADPVLWGECLSGALYWNDFVHMAKRCGFADPRLMECSPITIQNAEVEEKLKGYDFFSATYRMWKLPEDKLEPDCENYGQAVIYLGTVPGEETAVKLDDHHVFRTGEVALVCGNTYNMLKETRYNTHFTFIGDWSRHFGIFDGCGESMPFSSGGAAGGGGACAGGSCC